MADYFLDGSEGWLWRHRFDISLVIIFLGIVSNTSCSVDTRAVMVKEGRRAQSCKW